MAIKISTGLPNCREGRQNLIGSVDAESIVRVSKLADELGYYALWPNEFFVTFPQIAARYADPPNLFDTIVTMSYAAAATKRIRITPSTIVLPLHEPLLLSRQIATLDVFSGGRIGLGIGLGGSTEEFRSLHGELQKPNRGKMMDEYIQALRVLWTERKATFKGQYASFENVETHPKPIQQPLPIYMAGHAEGVFRRLAVSGQGWIDSGMPPDELKEHVEQLYKYADEAGRKDATFEVSRQFYVCIGETDEEAKGYYAASIPPPNRPGAENAPPPAAPVGTQVRSLIGTPAMMLSRLKEYAAAGATELVVIFHYANAESAEQQLKLFAEKVMPELSAMPTPGRPVAA